MVSNKLYKLYAHLLIANTDCADGARCPKMTKSNMHIISLPGCMVMCQFLEVTAEMLMVPFNSDIPGGKSQFY